MITGVKLNMRKRMFIKLFTPFKKELGADMLRIVLAFKYFQWSYKRLCLRANFPKIEEVALFCGFSSGNGQGGFTLNPELLARLAVFGVELSLDLYPPTEVN